MAQTVTRIAARSHGLFLMVREIGMPEIAAAIRAKELRAELHVARSPEGLGAEPIVLAADEEIVWRTTMPIDPFFEGAAAFGAEIVLITKRAALPRLRIGADDPRVAELARVLARRAVGQ